MINFEVIPFKAESNPNLMCGHICRCEVLLITGLRSRYVADTDVIHKEMAPGMSSMIKVMVS